MSKAKIFVVFCSLFAFIAFSSKAYAEEVYYTNENGVSFTKEEYDFVSELYWDGYQKIMPLDQYNSLKDGNYFNAEIKTIETLPIMPMASVSDTGKTLKMSKACTTDCTVALTLTWNGSPTIRSYDVMGVYFSGTKLNNNPTTAISYSAGNPYIATSTKKQSNGFGASFKLPSSGSSIKITQGYIFDKSGTVDASYQHAVKNTTLAVSTDYTFSRVGYGGVFSFGSKGQDIYDCMTGIVMNLAS